MMKHSADIFQTSIAREKIVVFCGAPGNKFIYSNEAKFKTWLPSCVAKGFSLIDTDSRSPAWAKDFSLIDTDSRSPAWELFHKQIHNFLRLESMQHYVRIMDIKAQQHLEAHWLPYNEVKVQLISKDFVFSLACHIFIGINSDAIRELAEPYYTLADRLLSVPVNLPEQLDIAQSKEKGELLTIEDTLKMKYTWNVVCESMRLKPPVIGGFREATTNISYAGFTVPKGWKVHWNVYSTHMDPTYFPNPDKFDPSRFEEKLPPRVFVPFGGGSHMCCEKEFARTEILVYLHNVVTRFRLSKANCNEKIIYTPDPVSVEGLRIRLRPHDK
uniref:Cytochrome P450 n=1 Tax=Chenopodium quinoa TaxID=63459 RepID=A0A803M6R0_CHEQI